MSSTTDQQQIEAVLRQYERSLNTKDTPTIVTLYTQDGVFMPQHSPAQVGIQAVEGAYKAVFEMLSLDVIFTIHEIEVVGDYAFARTSSKGTQVLLAANLRSDEFNNELFVFRKENDTWKIARYLFATANPPAN